MLPGQESPRMAARRKLQGQSEIQVGLIRKDLQVLLGSLQVADSFAEELPRSNNLKALSASLLANTKTLLQVIRTVKHNIVNDCAFQNEIREDYEQGLDREIARLQGTQ